MNAAAASSWWTSTNRTLSWWRRSPSMIPLIPSPGSPNTVSTPHSASRSTSSSDAILSMRTPRVARRTAKSVCGLASRGAWETATGCRTPWEAGNGDEEAGHRRQAQRQEGPGRGEAEALDRQHAGQQAQRPGQAGRGRGPAQAYRRVVAQDPPGAVRDRQAQEPGRPLQDGPGRTRQRARLQVAASALLGRGLAALAAGRLLLGGGPALLGAAALAGRLAAVLGGVRGVGDPGGALLAHALVLEGLVLLLVLHIRRLRRHGHLSPLERSSPQGGFPSLGRRLTERGEQPMPAGQSATPIGKKQARRELVRALSGTPFPADRRRLLADAQRAGVAEPLRLGED